MPSARQFMGSYLTAADVAEAPIRAPIARFETGEFTDRNGKEKTKLIMHLGGHDKALVLNDTNIETCIDELGEDYETWVGSVIELFKDRTKLGRKKVDCIRVRFPKEE